MNLFHKASDALSKRFLRLQLKLSGQLLDRSSLLGLTESNSLMSAKLSLSLPFIAGKIGSMERSILLAHSFPGWFSSSETLAMSQKIDPVAIGRNPAGIFPFSRYMIELVACEMRDSLTHLDMLASWDLFAEQLICKSVNARPLFTSSMSIFNIWSCLESGLAPEALWLAACKGKTVLLITPFQKTIETALETHNSFYNMAFGASSLEFICSPRTLDNVTEINSVVSKNWLSSLIRLKSQVESKNLMLFRWLWSVFPAFVCLLKR